MITPWQVHFLGGLRIEHEGKPPVSRLRTAKTTALLAFLCAHIGRDQGRDELVERFWPDLPFDAGRNSLRIALSALRRTLHGPDTNLSPEAGLYANRTHVRLCAGFVETDCAALEQALRRGDLARAAGIAARGAFLPGVNEEWVFAERERIEVLREQALLDGPKSAVAPSEDVPDARRVPGSVPLPLGRFFGREAETARLIDLLSDPTVRLITITGPGGTGKTRIAVETARALREGKTFLPPGRLRGGVWFVSLVTATRGSHIAPLICQALPTALAGNADPLETLAEHLTAASGGSRTILLLDNLEQVEPEECTSTLLALLDRLPNVVCLTTSRRRIGVTGEKVLPLAPFPLPEADEPLSTLSRNPAVALFVDRAREADVDFALTARRAPEVVELCARMNGVPLALEMAASWAGIYTPGEIASRATACGGDGLPGRGAGRESRHRSLREVAAWSLRLLTPEARALLTALSVLQGPWNTKAAEQVAPESFSPETLAVLCDHSLISGDSETADSGASRPPTRLFQVTAALRPFARELLDEAYDIGEATRRRHAAYFTDEAARGAIRPETLADTLAALAFWEGDARARSAALRIVGALWGFWWRFGGWDEAQAIADRVLADVTDDAAVAPDDLSAALRCAGKLAYYRRDFAAARAHMDRRLAVEERRGRESEVVYLRANFATLDLETGLFEEARAAFEAVLPILPTLGSNWLRDSGYVFSNYAETLLALGLLDESEKVTAHHLQQLTRGTSEPNGIAALHWARLARVHRARGAGQDARACVQTSLEVFRECGEVFRIADTLLLLSGIARENGDRETALAALRESFALRRRVGSDDGFRRSIEEAALLLSDTDGFFRVPRRATDSLRDRFLEFFQRLDEFETAVK